MIPSQFKHYKYKKKTILMLWMSRNHYTVAFFNILISDTKKAYYTWYLIIEHFPLIHIAFKYVRSKRSHNGFELHDACDIHDRDLWHVSSDITGFKVLLLWDVGIEGYPDYRLRLQNQSIANDASNLTQNKFRFDFKG